MSEVLYDEVIRRPGEAPVKVPMQKPAPIEYEEVIRRPNKFSYDQTTGMPIPTDPAAAKQFADQMGKTSVDAAAGGGAGLMQSLPVPVAQLLTHGAATVGIPGGDTAAKAVDQFNDYLSKDRGTDYNLGRGMGEYLPMLGYGSAIKAAVKAPQVGEAVRELGPNVVNLQGLPAMAEAAVSKGGGIFSKLGETAGTALASGLMSAFTRPVDNAQEKGYWGEKAKQTAIDAALGGVGPGMDDVYNKGIKPVAGKAGEFMKNHPVISGLGGNVATLAGLSNGLYNIPFETIGGLITNPGATIDKHPYASAATVGGIPLGIVGALLRMKGSRAYNAPVVGSAIHYYDNMADPTGQ